MKKIFILIPVLALLATGCSLSQKSVIDNPVSNESAFLSSEQASDLNTQDQDLKSQDSELVGESESVETNSSNQNNNNSVQEQINTDWAPFKSSYFTLSFKVPSGFEVKEAQNYILVARSPYYTTDIGSDNAFLYIKRYDELKTRENMIASYKKSLKNWRESQVVIDGASFLAIEGTDIGSFEGDSAGQIMVVFFNASWLQIMERPANKDQDFDPIVIGNEILETFKFSK